MLLAAAAGTSISASAEKPLRLYLPQEVRLDGDTAELGRVGILLGDPALIEKAGRFRWARLRWKGSGFWWTATPF